MTPHITPENLIGLSAITSVLVPYVAAVLTQKHYPRWANETIASVVALSGGLLDYMKSGGTFSAHDINALYLCMAGVLVASQTYYKKLLPTSGVLEIIQWITGGKQNGLPNPSELADPLPAVATDTEATTNE